MIEIAAHEYFKKVGDLCTEIFLEVDEMKGILVGGPGATKNFFVDNDYLHHELKKKVINTFDTGYTDESGLNELIDNAKSALQHLEVSHEKEMMERLFREIRKEDGGQSAYGESQVRTALEAGAVEILLISEGMKMIHRTFECPSCGKVLKTYQGRGDEPVFKCPDDQSSCNLLEEEDIVEELARVCESFSTTLELISTDSSEGLMLLQAFGGIAAVLRYKMS